MAFTITLSQELIDAFNITKIVRHIPSGQREVYIVEANGRLAALKIMSQGGAERLPRELNVYKTFAGHTGIPVLIDLQIIGGKIVLLEEYVEGNSLNTIASSYKDDQQRIKLLIRSLVNILNPIWEADIVHRDIKPENIIIQPNDEPVLLDFGIAKDFNAASITEAGFQPFSPLYGAPEQYRGDKTAISFKTDLFSLGVLGYKLFYDRLPFGNTRSEIDLRFQDHVNPLALPSECPIGDFLSSCLSFFPAERPRNTTKVLTLLN